MRFAAIRVEHVLQQSEQMHFEAVTSRTRLAAASVGYVWLQPE